MVTQNHNAAGARAGLNTYALLGILEGALGGVALDELNDALLVRGEAGNLADQGAHVRHALSEALKKETCRYFYAIR
jgi:hypothetical protein